MQIQQPNINKYDQIIVSDNIFNENDENFVKNYNITEIDDEE